MHEPYITIDHIESRRDVAKGPAREPRLHHLEALIGTWTISGEVKGTQTYEWLPGDFYVEHHWYHETPNGFHAGLGLMGYDDENDELFIQMGDNLGYAHRYKLTIEPNLLRLLGRTERATFMIGKDKNTFSAEWEQNKDGRHWTHLCTMNAQRTQA